MGQPIKSTSARKKITALFAKTDPETDLYKDFMTNVMKIVNIQSYHSDPDINLENLSLFVL